MNQKQICLGDSVVIIEDIDGDKITGVLMEVYGGITGGFFLSVANNGLYDHVHTNNIRSIDGLAVCKIEECDSGIVALIEEK